MPRYSGLLKSGSMFIILLRFCYFMYSESINLIFFFKVLIFNGSLICFCSCYSCFLTSKKHPLKFRRLIVLMLKWSYSSLKAFFSKTSTILVINWCGLSISKLIYFFIYPQMSIHWSSFMTYLYWKSVTIDLILIEKELNLIWPKLLSLSKHPRRLPICSILKEY